MAEKKSLLERLQAVLDERGWRSESELTTLHKFVHFWVLLGRSFVRNRCPVRASALSYTTLLALIPMLAVAISITNSLLKKEGEEQIFRYIDKFVSSVIPPAPTQTNSASGTGATETNSGAANQTAGVAETNSAQTNDLTTTNSVSEVDGTNFTQTPGAQEDRTTAAQRIVAKKIHEFIQNTQSGTLGVTGMILLVVVGIRLLGSIESTFNDIWGVQRGRNIISQVQIYCTTILIGPLLLGGAAALASGPHLQATRQFITNFPIIGPICFPTLTLIVIWMTFAMFYQLVPNTKVQFAAALVGGCVAGTAWHLLNLFGFLFASRVVTYSKIYGSLGLVPVFMVGIYLSWFILLFGAQLAYAFQNRTLYLQEKITENVNQRGREFVALRLMTCIGQRFQRGLPPPTIREMSRELGIPSRLVQQVLHVLIAAHLITEVHGVEPAYSPARPLEDINAHHVLQAMRAMPGQELITRDEPVRAEVYGEFARIQEAEKQAAASISLFTLVNRAQARLELTAPKMDPNEIKMKPALAPSIEASAEKKEENKFSDSFAEHSAVSSAEEPKHGNARKGNEEQRNSPQPTASPVAPTEQKIEPAETPIVTPADEERDFPL